MTYRTPQVPRAVRRTALFIVLRCVAFVIVCVILLTNLSYLMRPMHKNLRRIMGYLYEEPGTIDVLFVGASSFYEYWIPLNGFHEQGIASYIYGASVMSSAAVCGAVKEALKTNSPQLVVIDVRRFMRAELEPSSIQRLRNLTDFLPYSLNRAQIIEYVIEEAELDITLEERLMLHFDLIRYHSEWQSLTAGSFDTINYKLKFLNKGGNVDTGILPLKRPGPVDPSATTPLSDSVARILHDLLEVCREEQLKTLFLVTPHIYTEEQYRVCNSIRDIALENGAAYLDCNDYMEEMGIDYATEFHDKRHLNVSGSEKFTAFLGKYLTENYDIPDRRDDEEYVSWHDDYAEWLPVLEHARAAWQENLDELENESSEDD